MLKEQETYYKSRQRYDYFIKTISMVNSIPGIEKKSVLDVGAGPGGMLDQIKAGRRVALDRNEILIEHDYETIKCDFLKYNGDKFDIVLCTQVLEHVDDKPAFARKLLETASDTCIASIPYKWTYNTKIHQNLGYDDILDWFPIPPDECIITHGRRLICIWRKK